MSMHPTIGYRAMKKYGKNDICLKYSKAENLSRRVTNNGKR